MTASGYRPRSFQSETTERSVEPEGQLNGAGVEDRLCRALGTVYKGRALKRDATKRYLQVACCSELWWEAAAEHILNHSANQGTVSFSLLDIHCAVDRHSEMMWSLPPTVGHAEREADSLPSRGQACESNRSNGNKEPKRRQRKGLISEPG